MAIICVSCVIWRGVCVCACVRAFGLRAFGLRAYVCVCGRDGGWVLGWVFVLNVCMCVCVFSKY